MTFFELILIEVEEMNLELPGLMEIGIKPVRINSSRLEHEYSRFRHACGHDVLNGPALERLFKRRIAEMFFQWRREGQMHAARDDLREANA